MWAVLTKNTNTLCGKQHHKVIHLLLFYKHLWTIIYYVLVLQFQLKRRSLLFFPHRVYDGGSEGDKYLSCGKIVWWSWEKHCNCCSLMAVALNSSQCFPFFILYWVDEIHWSAFPPLFAFFVKNSIRLCAQRLLFHDF